MKNKLYTTALLTVLATACSTNELSFESVESGRMQANENSEFNAKTYRQMHPEYSSFTVQMRGDSTQSAKCGQGDGWASIDLVKLDSTTRTTVRLKCSTVSAALGCMPEEDFKSRSYAAEDGKCNDTIPFPLPKIQK